jgi:hypothetical protein
MHFESLCDVLVLKITMHLSKKIKIWKKWLHALLLKKKNRIRTSEDSRSKSMVTLNSPIKTANAVPNIFFSFQNPVRRKRAVHGVPNIFFPTLAGWPDWAIFQQLGCSWKKTDFFGTKPKEMAHFGLLFAKTILCIWHLN